MPRFTKQPRPMNVYVSVIFSTEAVTLPKILTFPLFLTSKLIRQFYVSSLTKPRHISIYYSGPFHPRPISGRIFPHAFFFFAWEYASVMLWTEAYSCLCLGSKLTEAVKLVRFTNPKSQHCSSVFNIRKTYAGSVDPKSRHHCFAPPPHRLAIELAILVAPPLLTWISPLCTVHGSIIFLHFFCMLLSFHSWIWVCDDLW